MYDFPTIRRLPLMLALCGLVLALPASAQEASRLDRVLDQIIDNERQMARTLERYQPLVETYIQTVKPDPVRGSVPVKDNYFLGRLELPKTYDDDPRSAKKASKKKSLSLLDDFHSQTFKPENFARMLILDRGGFDRNNYAFDAVRAEFLGEVRTIVFDVTPRDDKVIKGMRTGRFVGRIWVEDQTFNIVRFNGIYASAINSGFHFDSWRLNMTEELWLPAYVYTEEPDRTQKQLHQTHKGQTRIWGYDTSGTSADDEFTKILIDSPDTNDAAELPGQLSPVESARIWEHEAQDNILRRLERSGLLAPKGEVDDVLTTVVANIEITNELNIQPPIQCRVLVTSPLESFTVGHTIVLSRGLVDTLPDEASLAMVLAHEMGHILSGHRLDTMYGFSDQILVGDRQAMDTFLFERNPAEDVEADARAVELLQNSPYKDQLINAGLYLRELKGRSAALNFLIHPHFGSGLTEEDGSVRMNQLAMAAPELDPRSVEQQSALPLGSRVKLDPWNAGVELMKNNRVALNSASEKMPFLVTPMMPYLARYDSRGKSPRDADKGASASGDSAVPAGRSR